MAVLSSESRRRHAARAIDWKAGIWAGIIAGAVSDVVLTAGVWLQGESPWTPAHMVAAMLLGGHALPPPADFDMGVVAVASVIHFALAVGYGLVGAWLFERLSYRAAAAGGALYGLALYAVNYYLIAPLVFPWLIEMRGAVGILAHLAFGAVLALIVVRLHKRERASAHAAR